MSSAPQGALRLNVLGEAGLEIPLHQVAEGYRSEKLPPGRYRLSVAGDGVAAQMLPFEIGDGVDTEIALATEVGIPRDFEIDLLLPDHLPTEVRLRIDSGAGEVAAVSIQVNALRLAHRAWLQPGEYVATVSGRLDGEDREFASMRFRVADIDARPVRLEVR